MWEELELGVLVKQRKIHTTGVCSIHSIHEYLAAAENNYVGITRVYCIFVLSNSVLAVCCCVFEAESD